MAENYLVKVLIPTYFPFIGVRLLLLYVYSLFTPMISKQQTIVKDNFPPYVLAAGHHFFSLSYQLINYKVKIW